MIAEEMVCIDVDLFDDAAQSQLNHTPIVSRSSPAATLPTVHPFAAVGVFVRNENAAPRFEEILFLRKKFIVRDNGDAADAFRCKIDQTCRCWISCCHSRAAVGRVIPRRDEQRHMILRARVGNDKAHWHAIEKFSLAEIIADEKDQLVSSRDYRVAFK